MQIPKTHPDINARMPAACLMKRGRRTHSSCCWGTVEHSNRKCGVGCWTNLASHPCFVIEHFSALFTLRLNLFSFFKNSNPRIFSH